MRVLLAASGGEGHLGPLLPFAQAARDAGDEVLVVVPPEQVPTVEALDLPLHASAGVDPAALTAIRAAMATADRAERSRLSELELFGRLCTAAALPATERAAEAFRPQLILREPCDYASAVVAHRAHEEPVHVRPARQQGNERARRAQAAQLRAHAVGERRPRVEPHRPGERRAGRRAARRGGRHRRRHRRRHGGVTGPPRRR